MKNIQKTKTLRSENCNEGMESSESNEMQGTGGNDGILHTLQERMFLAIHGVEGSLSAEFEQLEHRNLQELEDYAVDWEIMEQYVTVIPNKLAREFSMLANQKVRSIQEELLAIVKEMCDGCWIEAESLFSEMSGDAALRFGPIPLEMPNLSIRNELQKFDEYRDKGEEELHALKIEAEKYLVESIETSVAEADFNEIQKRLHNLEKQRLSFMKGFRILEAKKDTDVRAENIQKESVWNRMSSIWDGISIIHRSRDGYNQNQYDYRIRMDMLEYRIRQEEKKLDSIKIPDVPAKVAKRRAEISRLKLEDLETSFSLNIAAGREKLDEAEDKARQILRIKASNYIRDAVYNMGEKLKTLIYEQDRKYIRAVQRLVSSASSNLGI